MVKASPGSVVVQLPSHYGAVWVPQPGGDDRECRGGDVVVVPQRWAEAYGLVAYEPPKPAPVVNHDMLPKQ